MAKDSKKSAAFDSGMRGAERPTAKTEAPKLASGAECVTVRRAQNGFIASCSFPPKKDKYGMGWTPPVDSVFATAAEVAEFIEKMLGVKDKEK